VIPLPLEARVVALAVVDYLMVSYHFAAQHFGLLSLYRARAGRGRDARARRLDRWYALVVGGGFVVLAEALAGTIAYQEQWVDPLLGAIGADRVVDALRGGGILVVVVLTVLMLRAELGSPQRSLPRAIYVVGVSAMVLVAFAARAPFLFIVLWSVQHWTAAMGLTSLAASGVPAAPGSRWQRVLAPVNRRGWAVLLVLAAIGALLLPVMEVQAVSDEYVYADRIYGAFALWLRSSPLVPTLLAVGFASGFIHYALDRAVFRFSSPDVRKAAPGLLQAPT
jgi:hypothetical protein